MAVQFSCASCGRQFHIKEQFRATLLKCPACKAEAIVDGPHVRGYDAFVSYSAKDAQVADAIVGAMESKSVRCWIAPRDIDAGAPWGAAIIDAIEDSRVMVLVFSAHSNASDQVMREVERAVAKKVPIIPFRIDDAAMSKSFEYFLATSHWLTATEGGIEKHLSQLTSNVRQMLLVRAADAAGAPMSFRGPAARRTEKARAVVLICLAAAIVVAVGTGLILSRKKAPSAVEPAPSTLPTPGLVIHPAIEPALSALPTPGLLVRPAAEPAPSVSPAPDLAIHSAGGPARTSENAPDTAPAAVVPPGLGDLFQTNTTWVGGGLRITITERRGEHFAARLEAGESIRLISGSVRGGTISWAAKDVTLVRGHGVGSDTTGVMHGDKIDCEWTGGRTGVVHPYTLQLQGSGGK